MPLDICIENGKIISCETPDDSAADEVTITVIATGVEDHAGDSAFSTPKKAAAPKASDFAYRVSNPTAAQEPKFESGFNIPKPQKEVRDINIPTFLKRN